MFLLDYCVKNSSVGVNFSATVNRQCNRLSRAEAINYTFDNSTAVSVT